MDKPSVTHCPSTRLTQSRRLDYRSAQRGAVSARLLCGRPCRSEEVSSGCWQLDPRDSDHPVNDCPTAQLPRDANVGSGPSGAPGRRACLPLRRSDSVGAALGARSTTTICPAALLAALGTAGAPAPGASGSDPVAALKDPADCRRAEILSCEEFAAAKASVLHERGSTTIGGGRRTGRRRPAPRTD